MTALSTVVAFIVAVGLLVTIHELGHYWVARWFNVKILRFSVGFGKTLVSRRRGPDETEWVLAAVPLGGYVRMLDDKDEEARPEDLPRTFSRQSVWKRIAIVLAGPAANFILAGLVYWALFVHGTPGAKPYLATPPTDTVAAKAGIQDYDLITHVDGKAVVTWQDVRWTLLKRAVDRGTTELTVTSAQGRSALRSVSLGSLEKTDLDRDFLGKLGIAPYRLPLDPVIATVVQGKAAERAGVRVGDRIVAVNDDRVRTWDQVVSRISGSPGKSIELLVLRDGAERSLPVVPEAEKDATGRMVGRIGIAPKLPEPAAIENLFITVKSGPVEAVPQSVAKVWEMSVFSLSMLGRMITGELSWRNLSGPISIADYAGQSARMGILPYLTFLALVSISIGVLNLLPIPVLDGGQLVYYLVEVFKGSPVPQRIIEAGQQVGVAVLLGLTAFAFYNDIHRLIVG